MRKVRMIAAALTLAVAGFLALPAAPAGAMECVRVPGLGCVWPPRQCLQIRPCD